MASILAVAAGAYLLVLGLLFGFQRQLLYLPSGGAPDLAASGLAGEMEPVTLDPAEGGATVSWFRLPPTSDAPVIVYFHGNGGHIGHRASKILPYIGAGYGVMLVGYRGYGGNPGRPSEAGLYADGRAVLDFLKGQRIETERLVLYGESLGSAVAVQMATEDRVAALVLEAPMTSVAEVAQARYPIFPVRWLVLDRFDSLSKIGSIEAPLLVLHGEGDRVVPIKFGRRLFAAAKEPKEMEVFSDAGHNDLQSFGAPAAVLEFLERSLERPRPVGDEPVM